MPSNQRTTISRRQQLRDQRARESAKETKRRRLFRIATGLLTTLVTDDQAALALLELAPVEQPALRHAGVGDAAS